MRLIRDALVASLVLLGAMLPIAATAADGPARPRSATSTPLPVSDWSAST